MKPSPPEPEPGWTPAALQLAPIGDDLDLAATVESLVPAFNGDAAVAQAILGHLFDLLTRASRPAPWGAYLAWRWNECVGTCAFKDAPDADGVVEIAYMTWPAYEGRGVATHMTANLLDLAWDGGARTVRAHTLCEENRSTGCLRRNGFERVGEVEDPEDGPVWRWELPLPEQDEVKRRAGRHRPPASA